MPAELTRSFLEKVVRSSGWALSEVESLSLEGESISCLGDSFAGVGRLVYLSLARNNITSLLGVEHLSSLSTAILRANRVSSMSEVGRLARLPNLRNLDLRLNPVMAAPTIGGDGSGSGSSRNVGGGSGGRDRGVYSQHDATTADAPWGRPEQEGFFLARTPREMVLIALPQLVNLDGQKVGESERRELRRRRSAVATPSAMSADLREEGFASAGELRPAECRRRPEEAVDNLHRSSWPRHDSAVGYCATDSVVTAPQAFAGGERARLRCDGEMVGASRSYDERDLRRVETVPSRGREAGRSADTGARKRDRTGAGVFESGGQDEGVPSLRAGPSRSSGNRTVDDVARNQQRPGHNRRAAGSRGKGIPPGAAPSTADDDDLAALWSELGEGFIEFQQPRAAAAATAADRSVSPPRPQCVPDCRRCGCSGSACECRDPLHSPARASRHTQLFAAELDESMSAVSFPGASRQTRHGPRIIEPRLLSDSEAGTKESALRRKGRSDDRSRRIGARSYADEWGTVGECDGDRRRIDGGGGGDSTSFRGSSGSSRVDTNPKLVVSSSLAPTAPRSSSSNSHGGNQEPAARVSRGPDAFAGRWGTTDAVRAAETKLVAHPGNRSNGGGKQQEARSRRHPPPEPTSARNVVRRQKSDSAAAPGSLSEPPSPQSQPVPAVPTDNATSTVAVARCTPPAQSGSSSSSTTTAAARAVEAFRRSSQRLGLVDAGKTDSRSPATYREGGVVAADECHGSVRSGPADAVSIDGGSPGPAPPVEATAELDTKAKHASVGGGKASEDSRGTDSTRTPSAIGGPSSTGTKPNAEPETSTALALPPTTETAVTSETMVSSEKAVSLFTEGVVKCQECGANFGKGYDKDSGAAAASAAAAGGSELHERWWAREREFTSRWAEREREFDARWTAREREYDNRRREESKEFTRGMRAMLFEAHNALIASNAWLLARLQTVESVQAPPPEAAEPDATTSATPAREPTLKGVGTTATIASRTGPRCPPPPQPTARRFVPDTYPTPLAEAEKEGQQRRQQQRKHSVLLPGGRPVLDASSLSGGGRHTPGGSTVTRDGDFPAVVTERVAAGTPVNVRAGSEYGTGHGTGGTGGRLRQAPPAVEDGSDRGPRGETGRVYAGGEAFQQPGDARNSRSLVGGVDPVVVVFPRPKTAACAPRETRELSGEASEFPIKIAASSETDARYPSAAAAGGRRDVPPPREFATGRRSEEACFDVQGVRGGCTGLERLVSAGDAVGAGRRREQNAGESALATAAATITKVEGSSASTPPAALGNIGSGSFLGGAEGGSGGGGSSNEIRGAPIPRSSGGGNDRREDGTGGAERGSAFASAHASVPAESNKRVATLGEENGNRVLGGKPADPSDAGGQKRVDVDAGVRVGVSSGGNGGRIVLGRNTTISPSEERDKRDAVWRRDRGVGGNGALCPDPEVTTSAPDG